MKKIIALAMVFLLAGCASSVKMSSLVSDPTKSSDVVIVRADSFLYAPYSFDISIDNEDVLSIRNNEFTKIRVDEGHHELKVSCMAVSDSISFEANTEEPTYIVVLPKRRGLVISIAAFDVPEIRVKNILKTAKRIGLE